MPTYKAPLRDMRFLMTEMFDYKTHYAGLSNGKDADPETVDAILAECAKLCENVLAPLNLPGDLEGCHWENGEVRTPKGFKEAYEQYVAGGWQGLSHPQEYGGQGMPMSLGLIKSEMMGTANWSFTMYPGLSLGAMNTIMQHGTPEQLNTYMPPLVEGRWTGTMCLTEAHCGTDLGQMKSKAEPQADGSYKITGTKIFISAGEHDLAENIIHIVLARLPDAPAGTKGISLFIVPKFLVNADGSLGERNNIHCGSIEHKMGIKASATCVMNMDAATGYMIARPNEGLNAMFTFMNSARIGTAVQGVAHAEASFQGALAYAKDRRSMRALRGKQEPDQVADAIIHHADVRRMLLTQKAVAEGGRAMLYFSAQYADHMVNGILEKDQKKYELWDDKLGFLTPILKGFLTEMGLEAANIGMQVFGGHGYIKEHGMEQIARDARISTLYEGTTGIQALDLLGRKVLQTQGAALRTFTKMVHKFCQENANDAAMKEFVEPLATLNKEWGDMTMAIGMKAMQNPENAGAAAVDYLMYSGYVTMAYFWARMAKVAQEKLVAGNEADFYDAKVKTARFYFKRILPRTASHKLALEGGLECLMDMKVEQFAF